MLISCRTSDVLDRGILSARCDIGHIYDIADRIFCQTRALGTIGNLFSAVEAVAVGRIVIGCYKPGRSKLAEVWVGAKGNRISIGDQV